MTEPIFDHDRLDVYRLAVEYTAESFRVAKGLSGLHRHARDQWLRAAPSIPLNVAEGNGKRSRNDRARLLDIARWRLGVGMCRDPGRSRCLRRLGRGIESESERETPADRLDADSDGDEGRRRGRIASRVP